MTLKYVTRCEYCHVHNLKCDEVKPCFNCQKNGLCCEKHVHGNTRSSKTKTTTTVAKTKTKPKPKTKKRAPSKRRRQQTSGFWRGFLAATVLYLSLGLLCWSLATYSLVSYAVVWEQVGQVTLEDLFTKYVPRAFPAVFGAAYLMCI